MFLTVHGAIGIIIGQQTSNPFLAFLFGFIGHYLSDIIPHGDTKAPKNWKNPIYLALAALIDMFILIVFLLIIGTRVNILNINTACAVIGSLLPDFLQGFYFLSNKKILKRHQKFHDFFHSLIADKYEWKMTTGLIFQIIIFIVLISIIL